MTLNDLLKGAGPQGITFNVKTVGTKRPFEKKAGGTYEAHSCELEVRATGEIFEARLFPNFVAQHNLKPGSLIKGVAGTKYTEWYPVTTGEQSLSEPSVSNYREVKAEFELSETEKKMKAELEKKIISQICHGFMEGAIAAGKTVEEAAKIAEDAFYAHKTLVERISSSPFA